MSHTKYKKQQNNTTMVGNRVDIKTQSSLSNSSVHKLYEGISGSSSRFCRKHIETYTAEEHTASEDIASDTGINGGKLVAPTP